MSNKYTIGKGERIVSSLVVNDVVKWIITQCITGEFVIYETNGDKCTKKYKDTDPRVLEKKVGFSN